MPEVMTDDELRNKALAVLQQQLGPVDALRFLALLRRQPFDYQSWREKVFAGMTVQDLLDQMQQMEMGDS